MKRAWVVLAVGLLMAGCDNDDFEYPHFDFAGFDGAKAPADLATSLPDSATGDLATSDLAAADMVAPDMVMCAKACTADIECTSGSACVTASCTQGCCTTTNVAQGTKLIFGQVPGDCQDLVCDGNGNTTTQDDPTDVPVSMTACETASCTGTPLAPKFTPVSAGTDCTADNASPAHLCGTGATAGECVQCVMASDCQGTSSCVGNVFQPAPTCTTNGACTQPKTQTCSNGTVCDPTLGCIQCNQPGDCGTDTECQVYQCTSHVCIPTEVPTGTPTSTQTSGDCEKNVCDGAGSVVQVVDDTDLPSTNGNQCLTATCTSGVPSTPPAPPESMCTQSGGSHCNGSGTCVQCVTATDCPTPPSTVAACGGSATCNGGVCGSSYPGTFVAPASLQEPGDCQKVVCNGAGGAMSVDDATDIPTPTTVCQTNPACAGPSPLSPHFDPAPTGTDCTADGNPPNHVCGDTSNSSIEGMCVQCNSNTDCTGAQTCDTSTGTCQ